MTERRHDELRPVRITRGYTEMTPGSVLIEVGRTRVLCTAPISTDVPPWPQGQGNGSHEPLSPGDIHQRDGRGGGRKGT